jgi:hypothetical protein
LENSRREKKTRHRERKPYAISENSGIWNGAWQAPTNKFYDWSDSTTESAHPQLQSFLSPVFLKVLWRIQRRVNGKTGGELRGNAINRNVPDLDFPAFAGMAKSGIALRPESPKESFETIYPTS